MRNRNAKALNGNAKRCFKLMIVDDSNLMRRRIERSQQFEDLQLVGTAGNGLEALELFKKTDPDVVTMDITMPRMDGIECIGQLVALKPAVRILVISALADKATAVEAMERGANGFLEKPFTDRQLNEALAELRRLGQREASPCCTNRSSRPSSRGRRTSSRSPHSSRP